jgi:serine/threonine protein kinase
MVIDDKDYSAVGRRYKLLNLIGSGGMGAVFRAFDKLTGRTVALKRMKTSTKQVPLSDDSGKVKMSG